MTLDDIRRLNFREAGNWPLLPKIAVLSVLVVLILLAGLLLILPGPTSLCRPRSSSSARSAVMRSQAS